MSKRKAPGSPRSKKISGKSGTTSAALPPSQTLVEIVNLTDFTIFPKDSGDHLAVTYGLHHCFHEERPRLNRDAIRGMYARHAEATRAALSGEEDMLTLAEIGYQSFCELFPNEEFRGELVAAIDAAEIFRIEVIGDPFPLPWGLLYTRSAGQPFDFQHFLGAKARLKRSILGAYAKPFAGQIPAEKPRIQFGLNSTLEHARAIEHPYLSALAPRSAHFDMLPPFKGNVSEGRRWLRKKLLDGKADIIHFACHGQAKSDSATSAFTIDMNLTVRSDILFRPKDRLEPAPIVFLNACEMGICRFDQYQSFVRPFLDSGSRAVLATECAVPDERAARFACRVYDRLIHERATLAEAVLATTRERCAAGDPIGLAYSIYGQADTVLMPVRPAPAARREQ